MMHGIRVSAIALATLIGSNVPVIHSKSMSHQSFVRSLRQSSGWVTKKDDYPILSLETLRGGSMGKIA